MKSKNDEAYKAIKNLIFTSQLFPGQKIIYRDLEEKLKMSKTPIINALMMLERDDLVVSKKNRGFYIRVVNREEAEKIYDLRQTLEAISIEKAIKNYTKQDLAVLKRWIDEYEKYDAKVYDQKRWTLDSAIHLQICAMGKNPFFVRMMEQFYENIYFMLKVMFLQPAVEKFKKDHQGIFKAIQSRDTGKAKSLIREHFEVSRSLLIDKNFFGWKENKKK
ncbi:MAG: GntR family transcriptional regulator [Deltaproteobacteria bacterium]|nr:GntR family transcriptional regulator [Deltaproteobacteria bacterium]